MLKKHKHTNQLHVICIYDLVCPQEGLSSREQPKYQPALHEQNLNTIEYECVWCVKAVITSG